MPRHSTSQHYKESFDTSYTMSHAINQAIESNFIFNASSLLGIFPFRVIENKLKVDTYLFIRSLIISSCIMIVCMYFNWTEFRPALAKMIQKGRVMNYYVIIFTFTCQSFSSLLVFVSFYFYRDLLVEAVDALDTLEPIFRKLEGNVKKLPIQKSFLLETLIVPVVCGTAFYMWGNTMGKIYVAVTYTGGIVLTALSCWQFSCFVDTTSEFVQSCSKFLIRIKPNSLNKCASLEKIANVTGQLFTIFKNINIIYSKILLIIIVNGYMYILLHLFYVYMDASSMDVRRSPTIRGNVMMFLINSFLVWRLIHSGAQAKYKSNEFNTLLYQLMLGDKTNKIVDNSKLMLHISTQREVEFSVCGLFNLDYTLLHSMIASASTYLVILIQFGDSAYIGG
ncbi:Gustatory receptor 56 [Halyomorpha halys]|nr:Gustatory receptor 56 [Halyomorpha halys]